ncbi:Uncharacterised protein [Chlamydia trachomatis]|nr:Uncharacterised protein [Chlamydia trachomatis]
MGIGQQLRIYLHKCTMGDVREDVCKCIPRHVFRYLGKEGNPPPSKALFPYQSLRRYAHMEIHFLMAAIPHLPFQRSKTRCAYTFPSIYVKPLNRK